MFPHFVQNRWILGSFLVVQSERYSSVTSYPCSPFEFRAFSPPIIIADNRPPADQYKAAHNVLSILSPVENHRFLISILSVVLQ